MHAAAHTHSTYGKAWATLGRPLDPLTQDSCAFYEDHAVFDPYSGVVLAEQEGVNLARTLGDKKAIILQNHGLLTVGPTVEAAAWWFTSMDNAAHAQLLAEAAGTPKLISPEIARLTRVAGRHGPRRLFLLPAALGGSSPRSRIFWTDAGRVTVGAGADRAS